MFPFRGHTPDSPEPLSEAAHCPLLEVKLTSAQGAQTYLFTAAVSGGLSSYLLRELFPVVNKNHEHERRNDDLHEAPIQPNAEDVAVSAFDVDE
jgi:hypothetical protein